jgi:RHS repeat-associated protein
MRGSYLFLLSEHLSEASDYGLPRSSAPPKYSWLGGEQRPTELPSGFIAMGARGYVPQLGRFLQTDPSPGGSNNPYGYTNDDPLNEADPSGEWTSTISYDYEAAEMGESQIPIENYIAAGAIIPPPVNMELELQLDADNTPWNAAAVYLTSRTRIGNAFHGIQPYMFDAAATGGPNHKHTSGSPNEGGHGKCRSGREEHGKCVAATTGPQTGLTCSDIGGAAGGVAGGIVGAAAANPGSAAGGAAVGSAVGTYFGSRLC